MILYADDNLGFTIILEEIAENVGHKLVGVSNGRDAVEKCKTQWFPLIFLDIRMPVMDGIETVRAIRKSDTANAFSKIFALTADLSGAVKDDCIAAGFDDFLAKPFNTLQLVQFMHEFDREAAHHEPIT